MQKWGSGQKVNTPPEAPLWSLRPQSSLTESTQHAILSSIVDDPRDHLIKGKSIMAMPKLCYKEFVRSDAPAKMEGGAPAKSKQTPEGENPPCLPAR